MSNVYKIIIEAGGEGSGAGGSGAGKSPVPSSPVNNKDDKVGSSSIAKGAKMVLAGAGTMLAVANYVNTFKMQELNIVTGETQLAQKRQAIHSAIGGGLSLAGAGIAGAVVGGPVGAVVGIAGYAIKEGLTFATKVNERNLKEYVDNEQLQAMRNRAGASFNRSRLN